MVDFRIKYFFVLFLILVFVEDVLLLIFFDYGLILYWLVVDIKIMYLVLGVSELIVKECILLDIWKILLGLFGRRKVIVIGNFMLIYVSSLLVMNWEKENER